jgi:hypothetical protein
MAASIAADPCPRDGDPPLVVGAKRVAQQFLDLVLDLDERGIEMPDQRRTHRAQHARVDVARAGAHQRAVGRCQFAHGRWCHMVS